MFSVIVTCIHREILGRASDWQVDSETIWNPYLHVCVSIYIHDIVHIYIYIISQRCYYIYTDIIYIYIFV